MNKYILLTIVLLTGCGGSSSTPIAQPVEATEPVEVTQPIAEVPQCPEVPECPPCPEVVEVEPEIVTYYLQATTSINGELAKEYTYNANGFLLTSYSMRTETLKTATYDENNNRLSFITEKEGIVTGTQYFTYDANSNLLTTTISDGFHEVNEYDSENRIVKKMTDLYGSGVYNTELFTHDGDNIIKIEYVEENRTVAREFDVNNNLIGREITINGEVTSIETYTWQEFTEEL